MSEIGELLANILSRGIGGFQTGQQINVGQRRQAFFDRLRAEEFKRRGEWRGEDVAFRESQAEGTADWRNRQAVMDMFQFQHGGAARAMEAQAGRESRERLSAADITSREKMNQARIDASMQEIIARINAGAYAPRTQTAGGLPASVFNMLGGKAFEQTRFKGEERTFLDILDEYQKAIRFGPNSPFNFNKIIRGLPPAGDFDISKMSEGELQRIANGQ